MFSLCISIIYSKISPKYISDFSDYTVLNVFSTLGVITLINTDWIYDFKETFICPWKVLRISLHNISSRPARSPRGSSFVQSNTQLVR